MANTLLATPSVLVPPTASNADVRRKSGRLSWESLLILPSALLLLVFFLYPVALLLWSSFSTPEFGVQNYVALLNDGSSVEILGRTFLTAAVVGAVTLFMAYPYAYVMNMVGPQWRAVLISIVLMPFWVSLMARTFGWVILLQNGGPVQQALALVGLPDVQLLGTSTGVTLGMVQVLLPYMVLPIYNSMTGIDKRLVPAALSLGAKPTVAFRKIFLPLSAKGVVAGYTLVFIYTLGFYITPLLLGSPQQALISQIIGLKVNRMLDFAGAGALAVILVLMTGVILLIARIATKRSTEGAPEGRT